MPLRSHYPEDDVDAKLRPVLRRAFQCLTSLYEFASIRDELYLQIDLDGPERLVWGDWHKLTHLALYNLDLESPGTIDAILRSPSVSKIALTKPDGILDGIASLSKRLNRPLEITLIDTPFQHSVERQSNEVEYTRLSSGLSERVGSDGQRDSFLMLYQVDVGDEYGHYDDDSERCQQWLQQNAAEGKLWDHPRSEFAR
ncbi:hypothetical protein MBLNU459_g2466t1 [Dothideomycetes sp. NU459]